jgi:ATP-dependent helicase HrpA
VEQLLVEPISQAAANQRAGRCGRVANGICIRLYDEASFNSRPRFTDPEILRSSLAGVILRMKSLHLGDVTQFPFIEAPSGRAIADGYQLLSELGAVDDANELTPMGTELSRLPLDPRVGRMIIEARDRKALDEVLVIASALSVQDVRDRPMEAQQQADQAHAKFDDEKSEFSGYLKLWKWINEARGGAPSLPSARAQKAMARRRRHRRPTCPWRSAAVAPRPCGQRPAQPPAAPPHPQAQQPPVRAAAAPELHQHPPPARVARHPHPAAHGGDRAQVADQHPARQLRATAPVDAGWPAGQRGLPRATRKTGTWARAASSSTSTPARTFPKSRAAGSLRRNWWRPRACLAGA